MTSSDRKVPSRDWDADAAWASLRPDEKGLVPAIVSHAEDGRFLVLAYQDRTAFASTLRDGWMTFFSRSRQAQWQKGETSGNRLELVSVRTDCDRDALWYRARPLGPTCHTGAESCFFRPLGPAGWEESPVSADSGPSSVIEAVQGTIEERKAGRGMTQAEGKSYVRSLLDKGVDKINAKIAEEAAELCHALRLESDERVDSEAADLIFHALVGLSLRERPWSAVEATLAKRMGLSGLDEKARRKKSSPSES